MEDLAMHAPLNALPPAQHSAPSEVCAEDQVPRASVTPSNPFATQPPHHLSERLGLDREPGVAELEFIEAIQAYKQKSGRKFPTWSEVLEVLLSLGYEKPDDAAV
jgi:hypothetical protein